MNLFDMNKKPFKFDKNKEVTIFEAFSGLGTQKLALDEVIPGYVKSLGISEIKPHAIIGHEALHGDIKNYGGIGDFDVIPKSDICTWSFPCQALSKAGTRKGMVEGTESNYGYTFIETLENMVGGGYELPKILLMENVPDLLQGKNIKDWQNINFRLEQLGYTNFSEILNAKDYGIPQNRKRIFMVSILNANDTYNYKFPKKIKSNLKVKDIKETGVIDESYYLSAKMIAFLYNNNNKQIERGNGFRFKPLDNDAKVAKTITSKSGNRMDDNFLIEVGKLRLDGKDMPRHRVYSGDGISTTTTNPSHAPYYVFNEYLPKGDYTIYEQIGDNIFILEDKKKRAFVIDINDPNNITLPEATKLGITKAQENEDVFYINRPHQKRGVVQKQSAPTIKANGDDLGIYTGKQIRKLTVRENGRLMGLTDKEIDKLIDSGIAKTNLYDLFGNMIVKNVLVSIFKELF